MAPCAMDYKLELTQIHNWLDAFVTFRPLLEHVYSKASQQTKNIYWSMVICNNFVQLSKILCNKDGQTKWLLRPSRTTILDNISHLKSSRIASMWGGILVHCCIPVSLLIGGWDWVQGGNPLYAAVKCLSDRRGQIWRIFFNFFAKSTCHIHFPGGIFFGGSKKKFYPLKWAIFWGHRHFPRIEGPFQKLRGRAVRGPQALCFGMFF